MRFSVLRFRPFFRSVIVTEKFRFFRFGDYCLFCPVSLSVIGKNKIGFSDLLFDAVLCFSGFRRRSCTAMDINCVLVLSNFACGLQF